MPSTEVRQPPEPPLVPLSPAGDGPAPSRRPHAGASPGGLRRWPFFRTRRRTIVTILVCVVLFLCLGYWLLGTIAFGDAASLASLKGLVQTRGEAQPQWSPARLNQFLWHDQRIRTGSGSAARLLFFDASTAELGENTEVSILRVARRRSGEAVQIVLKTWIGKTAVRAVRFIDPSSSFRIETPTSSTVVRGARFTVQIAEDGTTQIVLEDGTAEVEVQGQVVALSMGERITISPGGDHQTERLFVPDADLVLGAVEEAWTAPGDAFVLELPESEVNQYLAAVSAEPGFFLRDTQVWFTQGQARIATTVTRPLELDLSALVRVHVIDGKLKPKVESMAAGIALPIPKPVLNLAMETIWGRIEEYLGQAYSFVSFSDVQIQDGTLIVVGHKQPDAPAVEFE